MLWLAENWQRVGQLDTVGSSGDGVLGPGGTAVNPVKKQNQGSCKRGPSYLNGTEHRENENNFIGLPNKSVLNCYGIKNEWAVMGAEGGVAVCPSLPM